MKVSTTIISCLLVLPVLITVYAICNGQTWSDRCASFAEAGKSQNVLAVASAGTEKESSKMVKEKLDGGLVADTFDERSCLSRYTSFSYRKLSPYIPSPYLLSRLRNYEDLHKRCGPHTKAYNESVKNIEKFGDEIDSSTECKYVVWISFSGLGNRILTLTSAFLYALLTNRVLLVDQASDFDDIFCEPFPETSWLLPLDFPILEQSHGLNRKSTNSYGNMNLIKSNVINMSTKSLPWHLYVYLTHDYGDQDRAFFCDQDQALLANVPWLIMKTNNYFVPSLFMIPSFEQELSKLFPKTETVFHHLGRYLFHPSNQVWELVTRYYHAYLAHADEKIGIQIRSFDTGPGPFKYVMDQIIACTSNEKLLPQVTKQIIANYSSENTKSKAVLVTSLTPGYFENLKSMYWENPTTSGEVIGVYQPSHEEVQHSEKKLHNRKALTEMLLLSFTDVLVTSGCSTFGYVAQGFGGLRPWIMYKPENRTTPDPPCRRAMSMEPCFHAPPYFDCKTRKRISTQRFVPHIRNCEDMSRGLKLVGTHTDL